MYQSNQIAKITKPKTMKNTYKIISGLFLFSILFTSCTSEEEANDISALELELSLANAGILTVESTTYIFKNSGETTKFIEDQRAFDFTYTGDLNYTITIGEAKHAGDDLIVTNPQTQEFIRLSHFKDLKNNKLQFDVEFSNGKKFYSVVYNSSSDLISDSEKCHDYPCRNVDLNTINSLLEFAQDDSAGSCKDVVAACARTGGKPSLSIKRGHRWFTSPESCSVECK